MNHKTNITLPEVEELLEVIFNLYGYDFRNYARASMLRRLNRFILDANIKDAYELKYKLVNDKKFFEYLLQRITVNVTEMFRDPTFYLSLKKNVIPILESYPVVKIWHPGCSSGEEVYSMAIILHEAGLLKRTRIYATDINPQNIEKAKEGIVAIENMKEYTSNYIRAGGATDFSSYYTARYNNAIFKQELRKQIIFSQHNLVTDQVFNEFQMVCCRNVMIYFNKALQSQVVNLFYDSLAPLGYLALGMKESLLFSDMKNNFSVVDKTNKIFRRRN
jgi:chemotaxis protein methyltransferase CheR